MDAEQSWRFNRVRASQLQEKNAQLHDFTSQQHPSGFNQLHHIDPSGTAP